MIAAVALCLLACFSSQSYADIELITEPRPGEEYVLVSSGQQTPARTVETLHKLHESKRHHSKLKHASEGIVAIEEEKKSNLKKAQKAKLESIELDIPASKIKDVKINETVEEVEQEDIPVDLEAMSESGKLSNKDSTTTQKPILTTTNAASRKEFDYIPINFDSIDDINTGLLSSNTKLETAGSEQKQRSRIQIKKGPNGQDYEYEYIYYYYDEDEAGKKDSKDKQKSTTESVHNSHDGPQKTESNNHLAKDGKPKYSTIERSTTTTPAPTTETQNEVLFNNNSKSRQRGRTVAPAPVEEDVQELRLPSSTRFPPRGRNLGTSSSPTTPAQEPTTEKAKQRGRSQSDNVADESIGQSRSRSRAHIRRPSSELVDLDSFKTHSGDIPSNNYKSPPSRYSSESKATTDASEPTAKEPSHVKNSRDGHSLSGIIRFQEILPDSKLPADYKYTTADVEETTTEYTTMAAMEKVALDLYAYLAGENFNNEINPTDKNLDSQSTIMNDEAWTTEGTSTTEEQSTTPTTTTTTTTTTPAPTTTTTTVATPSTRPSRFKGRVGSRSRTSASSTTATDPPQETSTRARGRFGKPGGTRRTTAAVETSTSAAVERSTLQTKSFGSRGLFSGRTRPSTSTAASADSSSAASETPTPRPRLRPALRRFSTTAGVTSGAAPEEGSTASSAASQLPETTSAPARVNIRNRGGLRPGVRLTRLGARPAVPASAAAPSDALATEPSAPATEPLPEVSASMGADSEPRPGGRGRPRLQVSPSPRPRPSVAPPARRPLLKKKLTPAETTTEAVKTTTTERAGSEESNVTETEVLPAESTSAPPPLRGLEALLARRRARPPRPTVAPAA